MKQTKSAIFFVFRENDVVPTLAKNRRMAALARAWKLYDCGVLMGVYCIFMCRGVGKEAVVCVWVIAFCFRKF